MKTGRFVILAALALGACQQGDQPASQPTEAPASEAAGPDAKPGLTLTGGRLVLPAVKGNPGAAYFELANGGASAASVAAVSVTGAGRAEMHETTVGSMAAVKAVEIKPGETASFAPGGKHVMVFDLPASLSAGGSAEITVTFADGDKLSAPLAVEPAGGMADHSGM